jgi:hypothetical protein
VARQSNLDLYDFDDPQWGSRARFNATVANLASDRKAQAIVTTAGATSTARAKMATRTGATHIYLLTADPPVLMKRIAARGRPDARREMAAVGRWYAQHDRSDGAEDFPGWEAVSAAQPNVPLRDSSAAAKKTAGGRQLKRAVVMTVRDW